jgi:RimJ/RimL family protein N-acetyltransferase
VIIETSRLLLRALTPDDAEAIVTGNRAGRSWVADFPTPGDVNVATAALEGRLSFAVDATPWGLFTVVERSSGQSIGGIGFTSSPDELGHVAIGYGICASYQGQGVATEAVAALCEFSRADVTVVLADTNRENLASQRVLEKCGFHREGETDALIHWRKELSSGH